MTVKELIEKLKEFPEDLTVIVNANRNELANGREVAGAELLLCCRSVYDSRGWHEQYSVATDPADDDAGSVEQKVNIHA